MGDGYWENWEDTQRTNRKEHHHHKLSLLLHVREQSHESRTFDRGLYGTLLASGQLAATAAHDATVRVDELLEQIDIFVVDMLNVVLGEDVHRRSFWLSVLSF